MLHGKVMCFHTFPDYNRKYPAARSYTLMCVRGKTPGVGQREGFEMAVSGSRGLSLHLSFFNAPVRSHTRKQDGDGYGEEMLER